MLRKSRCARGAMIRPSLGADIGVGQLTSTVHLVGLSVEPLHQVGRPLGSFAAVELIETDPDLGPERVELKFSLVQELQGLAHHLALVGELPALDLLADARLDVGGELDRHGCSSYFPE